jgi:hypothetical protein
MAIPRKMGYVRAVAIWRVFLIYLGGVAAGVVNALVFLVPGRPDWMTVTALAVGLGGGLVALHSMRYERA